MTVTGSVSKCLGMELWVGSNVMKLFSFLCLAASRMAHIRHFSCVYVVSYHNCFVCVTFLNVLPSVVVFLA